MPVDYSKWDALELSDDSDIEVHPNVDKRSFIRAKQNQIHIERQQRKNRIAALRYERIVNDGLLSRVSALVAALEARSAEAAARNPAEIAFQAVMESAGNPRDDQPPPRPEGVFSDASQPMPSYSKMLASLLDDVNKKLDERGLKPDERYGGMLEGIREHEAKIKNLKQEEEAELAKLEKEEGKKITSESIHTGFDSSHVNTSKDTSGSGGGGKVELLNPNFNANDPGSSSSSAAAAAGGDDDEVEASPAGKKFAEIKANSYEASLQFLAHNPQILTERETDGILILAFDAALESKDELSRQYVHQALLLQYCRALGKDGVALFFKRITTKGHQAQDVFYKDVQDTYLRIRNRSSEIIAERAKEQAEGGAGGEGVEQIQLHAVEPGTVIQITVPPEGSDDEELQAARRIFEGFAPEMKKALESGSLDEVNKVLGEMKVDEAEELINLFGEANILSLEEQMIDATTEEGQKQWKEMEEAAKAAAAAAAAAGEAEEEQDVGFTSDPE
ncbi:Hsp90 co-chaperone Cdc37 [Escovopsis weberi]|uniref:Hsp90 chaperone protein kinase-targeting subunit n=1 Tax=Escovopsis weberi TaxID=150374 RepID=A0A0M8MQE5_ESCWE|nr:Hsp90 co-chaperone Cdc37 [Escovopsis weberi]